MSTKKLIIIGVVAAAGWYIYKNGIPGLSKPTGSTGSAPSPRK